MENILVALIVAIRDISAGMEVLGKNESIFIDRPVLHGALRTGLDLVNLFEATVQKVDLHMKSPAMHVSIEIAQIRVIIDRFKKGPPAELFGKPGSEGGFTGSDVAADSDMFWFLHASFS